MNCEVFYDTLQSSDSADDLFEHIKSYAAQLGFSYVSYAMCVPSLDSISRWIRYETTPVAWQKHYALKKYVEIDPVVRRGMNSIEPLVWSQRLFAEAPQIWADAQEFGLRSAISQPSWAAQGVFGILTFLREKPSLSEGEVSMLRRQMQVVANLLHLAMYEHLDVPSINCVGEVNLTAREREILRWTSEGKTAEIIGTILSISTRTVNFHISNVLSKLVAVNKVQAVAKARTFGLL
ncbi:MULTISPECIES: LuxR family transcriptional regulator [Ochrobactrum]|uniref:HTH-type quorum sensing-dependent transcriptional regulator VjbR n=1 Tax=Ochrobactrum chromiisoli TaxID=2993941 RepID=A0ABT3QJ08_9HYPH|nr:LuxR family transcriptional regulator [Ochrobactrum chromiisoli]MCX2695596.1 LuxR family transcriptional regulator [Ochrobactrum chromiisoli]